MPDLRKIRLCAHQILNTGELHTQEIDVPFDNVEGTDGLSYVTVKW